MAEFKVGDKVRLTRAEDFDGDTKKVRTVTSVHTDGRGLFLRTDGRASGWKAHLFELVEAFDPHKSTLLVRQPDPEPVSDWRAWRRSTPGECPCGSTPGVCPFHPAETT